MAHPVALTFGIALQPRAARCAGPDAFNRHFDEAVQVVPKWPPPRLPPLPLNSEHADDAKTIDSPLSRKP
eukprot:6201647-Pleurochrysis_carterae.AAC.7